MIAELLTEHCSLLGFMLTEEQLHSFVVLGSELQKWNKKINLTAITADKEIAVKHFIDSLYLATQLHPDDCMLDIGSGAGFPVLPLKIVKPEIKMVSVDAVAKKVNFQHHIIRTLKLHNIEAMHARIEDLAVSQSHRFSMITSRAFSSLENFVSVAAPLLLPTGRLIAMKGAEANQENEARSRVLADLGFTLVSSQRYSLPYSMGERTLITLKRCKGA